MSTPDFKIIHGSTVLADGEAVVTLTDGVDYTLESGIAADAWFAIIANSRFSGMGRTAGGGSQNADRTTVHLSYAGNNLVLNRSTGLQNCRVDWMIIQYIGPAAGANEIKVRAKGEASFAASTTSVDVAIPGSVVSSADLVPFTTGQSVNAGNRNNHHNGLHTAEIVGGNVSFVRGAATHSSVVSYALVEFTGSNWTVHFQTLTGATAANSDQAITLSTELADASKAILHAQTRIEQTAAQGLDDIGNLLRISSATQLVRRSRTATNNASKFYHAWIIENPDILVQRYTGTMAGAGEEEIFNVAITEVAALDQSSASLTCTSSGTGTAFPRGYINHLIDAVGNVLLRQSDNGQTSEYALEVVTWPQSTATASSLAPHGMASDNLMEEGAATFASSLSIADVDHVHAVAGGGVSFLSSINPDGLAVAIVAESSSLALSVAVQPASIAVPAELEGGDLSTSITLSAVGIVIPITVDDASLVFAAALAIEPITVAAVLDGGVIASSYSVVPSSLTIDAAMEGLLLSSIAQLQPSGLRLDHGVGGGSIMVGYAIAAEAMGVGHAIGSGALDVFHSVAPDRMEMLTEVGESFAIQQRALSPDPVGHAVELESSITNAGYFLAPAVLVHSVDLGEGALSTSATLEPASMIVATGIGGVEVTITPELVINPSIARIRHGMRDGSAGGYGITVRREKGYSASRRR